MSDVFIGLDYVLKKYKDMGHILYSLLYAFSNN